MVPHFTFRNRGGHLILFTVPSLFLPKLRVFRPHCSTGLAAAQPQAPSPSSTVACQFLSYRTLKKWEKYPLLCQPQVLFHALAHGFGMVRQGKRYEESKGEWSFGFFCACCRKEILKGLKTKALAVLRIRTDTVFYSLMFLFYS